MNNENQQFSLPLFQRMLWWACGANAQILAECPSDHLRHSAMGFVMLLISLMAMVSAGFVVMKASGLFPLALAGGIFWGALVLSVDRLLLINVRKEKGERRKEVLIASPRLLLTVLLSVLITEPFLHELFKSEIELQLTRETQQETAQAKAAAIARFSGEITALESENERLRNKLDSMRKLKDERYREWMAEGQGTGGTGIPGKGPWYEEKGEAYRNVADEYEEEKRRTDPVLSENQARLKEMKKKVDDEVERARKDKDVARGLLARNSALFTIIRNDAGAAFIAVILSLAMIILESTPLMIKLFSSRRTYEARLQSIEQAAMFEEQKKLEEQKMIIESKCQSHVNDLESRLRLDKGAWNKITDAILKERLGDLSVQEAEVARGLQSSVIQDMLRRVRDRELRWNAGGYASHVAAKNGHLDIVPVDVQMDEPEGQTFRINFYGPEEAVKGRDLLYALSGGEGKLLLQTEARPAPTEYRAKNSAGVDIDPHAPLFSQLNGSRLVHLSPAAKGVTLADSFFKHKVVRHVS